MTERGVTPEEVEAVLRERTWSRPSTGGKRVLPIADPATAARAREALGARDAFARAVAEAVRRYRAAHRLSHRAFGGKVGMAGSDVARLERGEHAPSIELLEKLARGAGMHF